MENKRTTSYNSLSQKLAASTSDKEKPGGHRYGFFYEMIFDAVAMRQDRKLRVLEIGVSKFGGTGSLVVWQNLDIVESVVGIDTKQYTGKLAQHTTFYMIDAYQHSTIAMLTDEHEQFDIIIDDGSHLTKDQEFFLRNYSELLTDGGQLICEDIRDVQFYREMCKLGAYYGIDVSGNRPEGENPVDDDRILIKSKSDSDITQLPVEFPSYYKPHDTTIAISIPIYSSEQIKGAVLSAIGIINNTDLGERRVPIYFHVDKPLENIAVTEMQKYNVPLEMLRIMTLTQPQYLGTSHPPLGKKLMGLLDPGKANDVWLFVMPYTLVCTTGDRLQWYDKIATLDKPAPLKMWEYDYSKNIEKYADWVRDIALATGRAFYNTPDTLFRQECAIFGRAGLENLPDNPGIRTHTLTDIFAVPTSHAIVKFLSSTLEVSYHDAYLLGLWQLENNDMVSLQELIEIEIYNENEFTKRDKSKDKNGYLTFIHG